MIMIIAIVIMLRCIKEGKDDRGESSLPVLISIILAITTVITSPMIVASRNNNGKIKLLKDIAYICENYTEDKVQDAITEKVTEYSDSINHHPYSFISEIYWFPFVGNAFVNIDIESINEDNYIEILLFNNGKAVEE